MLWEYKFYDYIHPDNMVKNSFIQHLLTAYFVPGTIPNLRNTLMNKAESLPWRSQTGPVNGLPNKLKTRNLYIILDTLLALIPYNQISLIPLVLLFKCPFIFFLLSILPYHFTSFHLDNKNSLQNGLHASTLFHESQEEIFLKYVFDHIILLL